MGVIYRIINERVTNMSMGNLETAAPLKKSAPPPEIIIDILVGEQLPQGCVCWPNLVRVLYE